MYNHARYDFRVLRDGADREVLECPVSGEHLTTFPIFNKGTAFTEEERDDLDLRGLIPPRVTTLEQQVARVMENYRHKQDALEKYIHLISLMDRNETLFYRVVLDHLEEMLPIIYTPTVGLACRRFGRIYRRGRGIYLTLADRGRVAQVLGNWPFRGIQVIVVTDGERILGLGDLGAGGMGIPIGKLSLYVAAGGVHPAAVLPVCLDVGTNRDEMLDDPLYLGVPARRVRGEPYDALVEEFVRAARAVFPGVLIQFEDFGTVNALHLLERYRERICCFNDDVQGTGAVLLATLLAAERVTGRRLSEERLLLAGAGGAGVGIARQVVAALVEEGMDEALARKHVWMVDSTGLVTPGRAGLPAHKQPWAHALPAMGLAEAVRTVKPTALVGVSGQGGLFTAEVLGAVGAGVERPLILPLSNPTEKAECTAEQARAATGGRALVASGSPFPATSQCNNVYVFPGLGLGVLAASASRVTDRMFTVAARALAGLATDAELQKGMLLPPVRDIRRISRAVALAVVREAGSCAPIVQWEPRYLPYRRAAAGK
ncbi:MAG: NAD-dependent malic enzyme [Planctomycetes bacterium]|nr:NAD-dependent malic enzyme [Planctomycetota bacterium]